MSAPEAAADAIEDVVSTEGAVELLDETVDRAKEIARLRFFQGTGVGLFVGAGAGAVAGFIFAQRRLETKYKGIAEEEISEMREHYYAKEVARDNATDKGDLEEIVRERGYAPEPEEAAEPPMAVTPPSAVSQRAQEIAEAEDKAAGEPPDVEEDPEPEVRNIFQDRTPPEEDEWDAHKERSQRSPLRPYVIHRDEREQRETYDAVTYTYYEADDVLCDEQDGVIDHERRERVVGEANLEKFGHGSGDPAVVYVRNDQLEMDIEVNHSPNAYVEEVHGLEPEIRHSDRRRGKASFDDE